MADTKRTLTESHFDQSQDVSRTSRQAQSSTGRATSISNQTATGEQQQTRREFANIGFQMSFRVKIRGGQPVESQSCS